MSKVERATYESLAEGTHKVASSVAFKDGPAPDVDPELFASDDAPRQVPLTLLQAALHSMEAKFSNNCDCLTNTDCCQTCQTATCQSLSCQSASCQTCQSQCMKNCHCSYDCTTH